METLLNVSLPFFGLIFVGFAAGRTRLITAEAYLGLNAFVVWFALPAMLFTKMSEAPVVESFDPRFVAAYTGGGLISYGIVVALSRLLFPISWAARAMQGMGAAFGNVGFMGLPILVTLFGDAAVLPAVLVIVFDHIVLIPLTTAIIEGSSGGHASWYGIFRRVVIGMARNPLIISTFAGLLWGLTGLHLPIPLGALLKLLSDSAAPCALFALGLTLVGRPVSEGLEQITLTAIGKLAVHPLMVWMLSAYVLELDPFLTAIAVIQASMPTAANVYILATAQKTYVERTSSTILVTTILATVTVSAFMVLFTAY
ncbi:MAG TPA: AEC family transporter [Ferrovibrio sp.]|uniref:AEC family transporter n=1 Tax=Ferrovibrio sp. TaxID=1917215 RepID=UPI002ED356E9